MTTLAMCNTCLTSHQKEEKHTEKYSSEKGENATKRAGKV